MTLAYQRYGRALLRKAERILGSRAEAEDVVHALFTDLIETENTLMDLPYLYRAVTNRCLTHLRDSKNRARLLEGSECPRVEWPELRFLEGETLRRVFQTLDEETCHVVILRYFDDLTLEEIASTMNLSRKTVAKRLDQARDVALAISNEGSTQ